MQHGWTSGQGKTEQRQTSQPPCGVACDWCRCDRSRGRVSRVTDQPVIDINQHNDDEHECELHGHTDRDDWSLSITQ
jgi:hypothetical protein